MLHFRQIFIQCDLKVCLKYFGPQPIQSLSRQISSSLSPHIALKSLDALTFSKSWFHALMTSFINYQEFETGHKFLLQLYYRFVCVCISLQQHMLHVRFLQEIRNQKLESFIWKQIELVLEEVRFLNRRRLFLYCVYYYLKKVFFVFICDWIISQEVKVFTTKVLLELLHFERR